MDDGSTEGSFAGLPENGGIDVNRMTPSLYPSQLRTIRIFFAPVTGLANPTGTQIRLIAFAGSPGTTRPTTGPTLLLNKLVTIPSVPPGGGWIDFPIENCPIISSGDLYVGFQKPNPAGGVATYFDRNGKQEDRSFYSTDNGVRWDRRRLQTSPVASVPVNSAIRGLFARQVVTSVSAASYKETSLAPESVVCSPPTGSACKYCQVVRSAPRCLRQ